MDSKLLMDKVAEVAPEKFEFLVKTASEIKQSPFREEFVAEFEGLLKKAQMDWGGIAGKLRGGAESLGKGVVTTALGGIGLALAGDAYDATRRAIFKTRNYKKMLAANPDLKDKPAAQVQSIFSTLHRFNPEFSADPVVAGSFVRNHVTFAGEGVGLDSLKSLVDARKGLNESRRLQAPKLIDLPDREMDILQKAKLRKDLATGGREKQKVTPADLPEWPRTPRP